MAKGRPPVYLFDKALGVYGALMVALLVAFGRPYSMYVDETIFYAGVAVLAFIVARNVDENRSGWHRFLRILYPVMLYPLLYRETGGTMFLFFDQFLDNHLTAFELQVLGVNPTIYIDRHLLNVWTTEILSLCYWLYYPLVPGYLLLVYVRRDYDIVKSSMAAMTITFIFGYLLFFSYPIEGPRWFFAEHYVNPVEGPIFRQMVEFMIQSGAVRGGCMPSTHYAIALVITLFVGKYYRRWLWLMIPLSTGLALGTVWGRFHYVSDFVVGGRIALAVTVVVWRGFPADRAKKQTTVRHKEAYPYHAS